jgi:excisionase family DNA binding protein
MIESPYMTVPEVAGFLRRRETTIRAWLIRKPDFPQIRVGKSVLIPRDGLMTWIARQQQSAGQPKD